VAFFTEESMVGLGYQVSASTVWKVEGPDKIKNAVRLKIKLDDFAYTIKLAQKPRCRGLPLPGTVSIPAVLDTQDGDLAGDAIGP
jgi:hypothetical protein